MWRRFSTRLERLALHQIRRLAIGIVGGTVLLFGLALVVLPGPALLVIPAGLAILGLEFEWARCWMRRAKALWNQKHVPRRNDHPLQ